MVDTNGKADTVSGVKKKERRQWRSLSDEFKAGAVSLVTKEKKSITEVAKDLDVAASVVRSWVDRDAAEKGRGRPGVATSAEQEELARLRKEVRTLRMEREILKKAAAFFAREND